MGFLIPLGIKINFLFYPWSVWNQRGLELPAWEKLCRFRYTSKHQAKLLYGKRLLFSRCPMVLIQRQGHGKTANVCQHVTSQPDWDSSGPEGRFQGGERGEAENSVTWDHTTSDYLQYHCNTYIWLRDLMPKYSWINGPLKNPIKPSVPQS